MIKFFKITKKTIQDHMIMPVKYHEKKVLQKQEEYDAIQIRLKKFEKEQIERNKLISELDDIHMRLEKSKVDKISSEEYHEIYKKLLEIEKQK